MKKFHLLALAIGLGSSLCAIPLTSSAAVDFPESGDIDGSGFDDDLEVGEQFVSGENYYSYWFRDYYDGGNDWVYQYNMGWIRQSITPGDGFWYYDYKIRSDRFTDDSYATYDGSSEADGLWVWNRSRGWAWIDYDRSTPNRRVVYKYSTRRYVFE